MSCAVARLARPLAAAVSRPPLPRAARAAPDSQTEALQPLGRPFRYQRLVADEVVRMERGGERDGRNYNEVAAWRGDGVRAGLVGGWLALGQPALAPDVVGGVVDEQHRRAHLARRGRPRRLA